MNIVVVLYLVVYAQTLTIVQQIMSSVYKTESVSATKDGPRGDYIDYQYLVNFKNSYSNPINLVGGFYDYQNCDMSGYHYLNLNRPNVGSGSTQAIFGTTTYNFPNTLLRISYFIFEHINSNIQVRSVNVKYPIPVTLSFSSNILEDNNSLFTCFFDNTVIYVNILNLKIYCTKSSTTTLDISLDPTQTNSEVKVVAIIMKSDYAFKISFQITSQLASTDYFYIPAAASKQQNFFIAISGFNDPSSCLDIALTKTGNLYFAIGTVFKSIYTYFYIDYTKSVVNYFSEVAFYPFRNKVYFVFDTYLRGYSVDPLLLPLISGTQILYESFSQTKLITNIVHKISTLDIYINMTVKNASYKFQIVFSLKILTAFRLNYNILNNTMDVFLQNVENTVQISDFSFDTSVSVTPKHVTQQNTQAILSLNYSTDVLGIPFKINYNGGVNERASIIVSKVGRTTIKVSTLQNSAFVTFGSINDLTFVASKFSIVSPSVTDQRHVLNPTDSSIISSFKYNSADITNEFEVEFLPSIPSEISIYFVFKLIYASLVECENNKNIKITLHNIPNLTTVVTQDFTSSSISFTSVSVDNNDIILVGDASNLVSNNLFDISVTSKTHAITAVIQSIVPIIIKNLYEKLGKNLIYFVFDNIDGIVNENEALIQFSSINNLTKKTIIITPSEITLQCTYTETIENDVIAINYDYNSSTPLQQLTTYNIDFSLYYCPFTENFETKSVYFKICAIVFACLYLVVFLFSLISCRKMYGIQLMFLIQVAYYSLIPINMSCYPFNGLEGLKYISGATPIISVNPQFLSSNYSSLGIQSNFFANVNILMIPLFIVPFIYFPLIKKGQKSIDCHEKPRCLKYGKSMLCQVLLTILLFNSFNICTSLVVNFQAYKTSNPASLIASIIAASLLPIVGGMFLKYKKHFSEFKEEFVQYKPSFFLSKQNSIKVRKCYPFMMILEMILIPLFLSFEPLQNICLYLVLGIEIIVTLYISLVPLYFKFVENFRNYLHRGIILSIIVIQILTKMYKNQYVPTESILYWQPAAILFLIFMGFLCTGLFTIYKCIEFWKSPKLVDVKLKVQKANLLERPVDYVPPPKMNNGIFYPRQSYMKPRSQLGSVQKSSEMTKEQNLKIQDKYHQWFNQIQQRCLFQELGLGYQVYLKILDKTPTSQSKFAYLQKYVHIQHNLNEILTQNKSIVTLRDYLDFLGPERVHNIKITNLTQQAAIKLHQQSLTK